MPAAHNTRTTKKDLAKAMLIKGRHNRVTQKILTENPIPTAMREFEKMSKEIARLQERLRIEKRKQAELFKKIKAYGLDAYMAIKVEDQLDEEEDDLPNYISLHSPTRSPSPRPLPAEEVHWAVLRPALPPDIPLDAIRELARVLAGQAPEEQEEWDSNGGPFEPLEGRDVRTPPRVFGDASDDEEVFCNICRGNGHRTTRCQRGIRTG